MELSALIAIRFVSLSSLLKNNEEEKTEKNLHSFKIHLDPATVDPSTVDFRYRRLNFLLSKKLDTVDFFATVDFSKLKCSKIPIFSKNGKIGEEL